MSSIDDIGFPKELLQNPVRIRKDKKIKINMKRNIKIENISKKKY